MWSPTTTSDELYHHGILGQRWGKKNGPPYPLDAEDHSAAEKKAAKKAAKAERRAERKERKKAKKEFKAEKKAAKAEEKRQKILREGSLNDIRKLKGNISNSEYSEVFKRLENEQKLAEFDAKKIKTGKEKMEAVAGSLKTIDNATSSAVSLYNRGAKIYNTIAKKKGWEPQKLPIIGEDDKDEEKAKKAAKDYFINKATPDQINATKSNFSGEDLGKAMARVKTNESFEEFYKKYKEEKKK